MGENLLSFARLCHPGYPQARSLDAHPRAHELFRQKSIFKVILSTESTEQHEALGHTHISNLRVQISPWTDTPGFGHLRSGKGGEWKEKGTGWTFALLLLWAPFNFITPTPSLLWFLYLKTLVSQIHKGFLPKLPDRWLCMGRDGRVGRREQRESYVLKKKNLKSRGKKRCLIWQ